MTVPGVPPTTITVPKNGQPIQIPIAGGSEVTLVNLSTFIGLTLCQDERFNPDTSWELPAGAAAPQIGVSALWVKNTSNLLNVMVLVLQGSQPYNASGATPLPYTILDETKGPIAVGGFEQYSVGIQPTSTWGIVVIATTSTVGVMRILATSTISLSSSTNPALPLVTILPIALTVLNINQSIMLLAPIVPDIYDTLTVTLNDQIVSGNPHYFISIFESNADLGKLSESSGSIPSITNYALETGGNLAAIDTLLGSVIYAYAASLSNPSIVSVGGLSTIDTMLPIRVSPDGSVYVRQDIGPLWLTQDSSSVDVNLAWGNGTVMMAGGYDGTDARVLAMDSTGQAKVLIENSPTVNIGTMPSVVISSMPSVVISGTVSVSGTVNLGQVVAANGAAAPSDGIMIGGYDGTHLQYIATDGGGQVKVLVENTPSVTISGTPSVTISGTPTVNIGTMPNVTIAGTVPISVAAPSNTNSAGNVVSLLVKNGAGTLYGFSGYSPISQYVQVLDANALVSGTTVPVVVIFLLNQGSFAMDFGVRGRAFANGIYLAFSSTETVFNTGTAGWLDAQYV